MSLETPTWDKITGSLGSTTLEFGGDWANLISDYYNGIDIGITDPTKKPIINTLTRFRQGKLGFYDPDESHYVTIIPDDIDTGPVRNIRIRRMNAPYQDDYAVLEGMPQIILNKNIDSDLNTITNIVNADIKTAAGIVYSKLNLTNSIIASDITSDAITTAKILDSNITLAKLASNSVNSSKIVDDSIVNADINSAAAIAWTKLSKTGSILDDIEDVVITTAAQYNILMRNGSSQWVNLAKGANSTALTVDASGVLAYTTITNAMLAGSIAYSKLTLSNSIVNADIASAAAIAYSKLSLSNSILNADINSSAAIATSKLADSANFILKTLDNSFGAHYFDITKMTAPVNPAANDGRFYTKQIDTNNDGFFVKIKKNGSFQEIQIA